MKNKQESVLSLLVLAPWGIDTGFRLGGARVKIINSDSLNTEIENAIESSDVGVLAIPESMRDVVSPKNRKRFLKEPFPLPIYYPFPEDWEAPEGVESGLEETVRRAIGYRLRIKV